MTALIALAGAAGLLIGFVLGRIWDDMPPEPKAMEFPGIDASYFDHRVYGNTLNGVPLLDTPEKWALWHSDEAMWQRIQDRIVVNELVGYDTAEEA